MQAKRDARARYMRQYRKKAPAVVMWGSNAALALALDAMHARDAASE